MDQCTYLAVKTSITFLLNKPKRYFVYLYSCNKHDEILAAPTLLKDIQANPTSILFIVTQIKITREKIMTLVVL